MKIAVIGSGYVGLVAAACLAEIGHEVICADNDIQKITALLAGRVPIHEEFLPQLVHRHCEHRLKFTTSTREAVRAADVVFIAVGTPSTENGGADLRHVEGVACEIASSIDEFKIVVEKSTVPVYTNEWIHRTMKLNGAPEDRFEVVSNPEFLREGTAVTDFLYPDRIVIGCHSNRAVTVMQEIYAPILDGTYEQQANAVPRPKGSVVTPRLIHTTARSAELIKHASNAFLAMKISFINAVANICEAVGADIEDVAEGVGADTRIGSRFLRAGLGYGGSCFPKDISAFKIVARENGYDFKLLDEVTRINDQQRTLFVGKLRAVFGSLEGMRFGVLGLSFKGGTDDIRESPAVGIVQELLAERAAIVAFDPVAMDRAAACLQDEHLTFTTSPYKAAQSADALLILTDWPEFGNLDLVRIAEALHRPIVFDGRNLYAPEEMIACGLSYHSVGRAPAVAASAVPRVSPVPANTVLIGATLAGEELQPEKPPLAMGAITTKTGRRSATLRPPNRSSVENL